MDDDNTIERLVKISEQLTAILINHDAHLTRIDTAIEGINTTMARVETLLARILPQSENGRDA